MVNYPTILGLPQEDIDRQLYVGVLGLESRVKALENKPKPTPTQSGTVTVTTVDSEQTPLTDSFVFLCDTNEFPSEQDDSNVVAIGYGDKNGECSLALYDTSAHQQTEVTDIPFDDYYLFGLSPTDGLTYSGTLTVDGDETVTITLTKE